MEKVSRRYSLRVWLVYWLYAVAGTHLLVALLMTWFADQPLFLGYHQHLVASFGFASGEMQASELQQWWFRLFGATLQVLSLLLLMLIYCGDRQRSSLLWSLLAITLLWWAPQDMAISLQKSIWSHFWVDLVALVVLVLPLVTLAFIDRRALKNS